MTEEIKPIKRYECLNCKDIINLGLDEDIHKTNCCKNPNHKLILIENIEEIKTKFCENYDKIQSIISKYMDLPEEKIIILTLWIMGTYLHNSFSTYPILFINAMKGSGKSRLINLLSYLCKGANGQVQSGINETILFRTPKGETIIFDECESISNRELGTFRQYLNSSYKKGGTITRAKKVKTKEEENYVLESFDTFRPIAIANISGMENVLEDRCITLIIDKSNDPMKTKLIEDFKTNVEICRVKEALLRFSVEMCSLIYTWGIVKGWNGYLEEVYNNQLSIRTTCIQTIHTLHEIELNELFLMIDKANIDGRNLEISFPLLILAHIIDKEEFKKVIDIFIDIVKTKKLSDNIESRDISFIDFISKQEQNLQYIPIRDLTHKFRAFMGSEDNEDRWLNDKWLGIALKRLSLVLDKRREASGILVILNVVKAKEKLKIFKKEDSK